MINGRCIALANAPATWPAFLVKLAGWAISVIAAMQGAPFWFDILGKFINFRSSGKKPSYEKPQTKSA